MTKISRTVSPRRLPLKGDRKGNYTLNRERADAIPRKKATLSELHSASISLYRFILSPTDPRWRIVYQYERLFHKGEINPFAFNNARMAIYASPNTPEGFHDKVQLARALSNIEIGNDFIKRVKKRIDLQKGGYTIQFEQTKSTSRGKDERGVTGCPEAMWQMQLYKANQYVGRIGFNFHRENNMTIVTVSNIQGASGRKMEQEHFTQLMGKSFGEYLVQMLKKKLHGQYRPRGVRGVNNPAQYVMTFRKTGLRAYPTPQKRKNVEF